MRSLGRILLFLLAVVVIVAIIWFVVGKKAELTADLAAIQSAVERWDARNSQRDPVARGEHRKMREQDGVTVDPSGRAKLDMGGCILEIFFGTELTVQQLPSQSAEVCILQLGHGTIGNRVQKRTIVNTDWAVITTLSTQFLVHLDAQRGLLWVIVKDGLVEVAAAGERVRVAAGQQTWVHRGARPEAPRPATRAQVGDLFPPLEALTNGELSDAELLLPEPLAMELEQSTDEVISGECPGPHTMRIVATLSGSPEAIKNVGRATLRYHWEGIGEQVVMMERLDDRTFSAEIGPFDYCCQETTLVYTVDVFDRSRAPVLTESGKALLIFCIG